MSRIPYPDPATLSEAKQAHMHPPGGRLLNVVRMAMHTPDGLWAPQRDVSIATVFGTTIDKRLREVLILRVGALSNSEYELHHHRSIARQLGMPDSEIAAIEAGDYSDLDEEARVVAQFTTELVVDVSPSDATLAAARALFSDALIFEMVAIVGVYMMTARVIGVGGCELDEIAVQSWGTEKLDG
jgi:alkylhydroperoxidase family enzyme